MAKENLKDKEVRKSAEKTTTIDASIGIEKYSVDELLAIICEKDALIAEKDALMAEKDAIIAELLESNATVSTHVSEDTVDVAGVKYICTLKSFIHAGKRYTKDEVLKNPTIAAELVTKKSPALKKA